MLGGSSDNVDTAHRRMFANKSLTLYQAVVNSAIRNVSEKKKGIECMDSP